MVPLIKSSRVIELSNLSDHCTLEIEIQTQFIDINKDLTQLGEVINKPISNTDKLKSD